MSDPIKYEYKTIRVQTTVGLDKLLNGLSDEGWELCNIFAGNLILKRPRAQEKSEHKELHPDPKKNGGKPKPKHHTEEAKETRE